MMRMTRTGSAVLFENIGTDTLSHRSVKGAAITMIAQILRFGIQFVGQIALARLLDPADFGLLAMVAPAMSLVLLFNDLGLSQATIQRATITARNVSSLFWINVLASLILCAALILAAPIISRFYDEPRTIPVTIALSFVFILGGLSSQHLALLGRAMRFRQQAIIDVAAMVIATATGIAAAFFNCGYWSLVAMPYAMGLTTLVLAWAFASWVPERPRRNLEVLEMMRFGGHMTGSNLLNFLSTNIDNILIGKLYGSQSLGLYDRAYKLMLLPFTQITGPLSRVAIPTLSRLQTDPARYRQAFISMIEAIHLLAFPCIVVGICLTDELILTLFGAKWSGVVPIFFWLAIAALTAFLGASCGWLFTSQGRSAEKLKWSGVSAILFVSAILIGLPQGPVGVARAFAITGTLIQGPMMWWAVTRRGPVRLVDFLGIVLPFAFAGICAFALLWLCNKQYKLTGVTGLALAGAISYAGFAAALAVLPAGRRILGNALSVRTMLRRAA